jgi:hypothetical protein
MVLFLLLTYAQITIASPQLNTIFFSPSERAALVSARSSNSRFTDNLTNPQSYTITGFIKREDGKNIAWINNKAVNVTKSATSSTPITPTIQGNQPTIRIINDHITINGKPVQVGETLDTVSGERNKRLPTNAIKVR